MSQTVGVIWSGSPGVYSLFTYVAMVSEQKLSDECVFIAILLLTTQLRHSHTHAHKHTYTHARTHTHTHTHPAACANFYDVNKEMMMMMTMQTSVLFITVLCTHSTRDLRL